MTLQTLWTPKTLQTRSRARVAARVCQGRAFVCVVGGAIAIGRHVRRVTIVGVQRGTISIRVGVTIVRVIRVAIIAVISVVAIVRVVGVLVLILVFIVLILIRVLIICSGLRLVLVAAFALLFAFLILLLVGDAGGAFSLFGLCAADINGNRLPCFDDFARVRQL